MQKRVETGISGLDKMLYGGIPDKNMVLISGGPGAGKTLLSFEFLYRNAKTGHKCIFFTLEEEPKQLVENVKSAFSEIKDIDDVIKSRALIVDEELSADRIVVSGTDDKSNIEFGNVMASIESSISRFGADRIVIDSISVLDIMIKDPALYRKYMFAMVTNLRRLGVTAMITAELESPEKNRLTFRPEYFIFDGIIALYQSGEESKRLLTSEVLKMRGTRHSFVTTPYDITPSGFRIFAVEDIAPY
ncbi:MAG: ATPase domain-containing protein [Candidatus Micrarchaeaceae archaeon]